MAGLRARVEDLAGSVDAAIGGLSSDVATVEGEVDAFAPDVSPLLGLGAAVTSAKADVGAEVDALIAELRALAE